MAEGERSLAVFVDFENLALGFQGRRERFDIARVLERLVEKGKIVAKKAYADWNRFAGFTAALHEAAIELIEIPRRAQSGKNSADIRLCVDAMDLAYSKEHINTFVVVSGDSDFSPLVSKLKELGKHVIGLGMQESTSDLLRDNCDEFIYYEDLGQGANLAPSLDSRLPETKRKAFALLLESLLALRRENKEVLWSSMVKDTMKRKKPSFNETYHGYRTFSELLEDAQQAGLLELETDKRSRTYVVTRFGSEMEHDGAAVVPILPEPRPAPAVVVPPRVVPTVVIPGPRVPPVVIAPIGQPGVAIPVPVGEGPGGAGKKKSRRRRRRGQKDIVNGNNGHGNGNGNGNGGPNGNNGSEAAALPPPVVPPVVQAPAPPPPREPREPRETRELRQPRQPLEPAAFDAGLEPDAHEEPAPRPPVTPAGPPPARPEPAPAAAAPPAEPTPPPAKTTPQAEETPAPKPRTRKAAAPRPTPTPRPRKAPGETTRSSRSAAKEKGSVETKPSPEPPSGS